MIVRKALLVRRYGRLTQDVRRKLFPGWDVIAYGAQIGGVRYDAVVVGFLEETQREIEWVEVAQSCLSPNGKFIRIA